MPKVNLPPGCMGFRASDGTRYVAKPGTHVNVDDRHMAALKSQDYANAGLVDAGPEKQFITKATKEGRWCNDCKKLWHSWRTTCFCGTETVRESERPFFLPAGQYQPLSIGLLRARMAESRAVFRMAGICSRGMRT